jgi:hypothetical protein
MKSKIMFILAVMISLSFGVSAQNAPGNGKGGMQNNMTPAQRAQSSVDKMSGQMALTQVQKDSLTKVFTSFFTTMKANRESGNMDPEDMKALAYKRDQQVKTILNDDKKFAQYQQYIAEQRAKMKQGGGQNNGGNGN